MARPQTSRSACRAQPRLRRQHQRQPPRLHKGLLPHRDLVRLHGLGRNKVAASPGRGVASHCDTQSAVAPLTFFATARKLSGRNGKQPHNERKLNNMKPKIQRTTPMKQIFLYTSLALMALAVTTTGAAPEPWEGTVQLTSQSNIQVRQAGSQTS